MKEDVRPCAKCHKPILGQSHHDGSVWNGDLRTGVRLPPPQMGYVCAHCYAKIDGKQASSGRD
jgi:hypothetical protein